MTKPLAVIILHVQWFVRTWRLLSNWPMLFLQKFRIPVFTSDTRLKMRLGPTYIADKRGWGVDDLTAVWIDKVYKDPADLTAANPVILDVGAHIGTYAIYAALRNPKAHIYAFELNRTVFTYLEKSVAANDLTERVTCIEKGVAGKTGDRMFFEDTHGGVSSSLFRRDDRGLVDGPTVPCISLTDFFREYSIARCDVLKMNCEGAEYEILGSLSDAEFAAIDSILLQWHRVEGHEPEELETLLKSKGYTVTRAPKPYKFLYANR
ncbi:MAG: FkbM family methyltransferase [Candidatus Pacebacteria bacterium]|nr:FkbM family methyltransferase [Candidatus Paceibacterota bacterium]